VANPLGVTEAAAIGGGFLPPVGANPVPSSPLLGGPGGFQFKFLGPGEGGPAYEEPYGGFAGGAPDYGRTEYGMHADTSGHDISWNDHGHVESGHNDYGAPPPPPEPPRHMQEADRYDALAAEHERQAELLEAQPATSQILERQIQELLEGQKALRHELEEVKATVHMNYTELEVFRQEAQHQPPIPTHMPMPPAPQPYYYPQQGLPQQPMMEEQMLMPMPQVHSRDMQPPLPPPQGPPPMGSGILSDSVGRHMPPRNLGYDDTVSNVMESLSRMGSHVSTHARTLHGHATRSLRSVASGSGGANGGTPKGGRAFKSAC